MGKILLVEDDETVCALVHTVLTREGHQVVVANTGPDGERQYAQHQPDLLILDVSLPGLSGLEVLARLRARGDRTPALLATAERMSRDQALAAGADEHLPKPYDVYALTDHVNRLLASARP